MTANVQNPVGQFFLGPVFRILVGRENLQLYDAIDWQKECDRFRQSDLAYPHYYTSQNFHGIEGGYLNPIAAVTYDAIAAFASPPHETWIRQQLIAAIEGQPERILDLGCGTGTGTLMLKRAFPNAQVTGVDLSPHMLVMADYKTRKPGLSVRWLHALAEATGLEESGFDLVATSFLFHETPPVISQLILQECLRLLKPGGQVLILDGNQKILRRADWLIELFREPYSKVYASGNVGDWMEAAGFHTVRTRYVGWIHQVTTGSKAIAAIAIPNDP